MATTHPMLMLWLFAMLPARAQGAEPDEAPAPPANILLFNTGGGVGADPYTVCRSIEETSLGSVTYDECRTFSPVRPWSVAFESAWQHGRGRRVWDLRLNVAIPLRWTEGDLDLTPLTATVKLGGAWWLGPAGRSQLHLHLHLLYLFVPGGSVAVSHQWPLTDTTALWGEVGVDVQGAAYPRWASGNLRLGLSMALPDARGQRSPKLTKTANDFSEAPGDATGPASLSVPARAPGLGMGVDAGIVWHNTCSIHDSSGVDEDCGTRPMPRPLGLGFELRRFRSGGGPVHLDLRVELIGALAPLEVQDREPTWLPVIVSPKAGVQVRLTPDERTHVSVLYQTAYLVVPGGTMVATRLWPTRGRHWIYAETELNVLGKVLHRWVSVGGRVGLLLPQRKTQVTRDKS